MGWLRNPDAGRANPSPHRTPPLARLGSPGAPGRTRTPSLVIRSHALFPIELQAQVLRPQERLRRKLPLRWTLGDSNPNRPLGCKPSALPAELSVPGAADGTRTRDASLEGWNVANYTTAAQVGRPRGGGSGAARKGTGPQPRGCRSSLAERTGFEPAEPR